MQKISNTKMNPIIFNGYQFQKEKIPGLKSKVAKFIKKYGRKPCLVIFLGNDLNSKIFTSVKAKFGRKIGVVVKKIKIKNEKQLKILIDQTNESEEVDGVMIQLPILKRSKKQVLSIKQKEKTKDIINLIDRNKDVDGMRKDSPFLPATVRAIREIMNYELKIMNLKRKVIAVVGAHGWLGRKSVQMLREIGIGKIIEIGHGDTAASFDDLKHADVVISTVGKPGIITGDMLKNGCAIFDVGVGKGDIDFVSTIKKASFVTPVPGGLGPATITCLFENLLSVI